MPNPVPAWQCSQCLHKVSCIKTCLYRDGVEELGCSALSPDLNPTEHIWNKVELQVHHVPPNLINEHKCRHNLKFSEKSPQKNGAYADCQLSTNLWQYSSVPLLLTSKPAISTKGQFPHIQVKSSPGLNWIFNAESSYKYHFNPERVLMCLWNHPLPNSGLMWLFYEDSPMKILLNPRLGFICV